MTAAGGRIIRLSRLFYAKVDLARQVGWRDHQVIGDKGGSLVSDPNNSSRWILVVIGERNSHIYVS